MIDELLQKLNNLDLSKVKNKLKARKGFWWSAWNSVDKIEKEYKQFLYLIGAFPDQTIVPWNDNLDDLWHEHILDTKKYEEDCEMLFGRYIHHNPHLDVGSTKQVAAFQKTKDLHREQYSAQSSSSKSKSSASNSDTVVDGGGGEGFFTSIFGSGCGSTGGSSCGSSCGGGSSCGSSCGSSGCGSGCGGGGD